MDFKEIMLEMLNNVKKNEITIFTESNEDNEILNKVRLEVNLIFQRLCLALLSRTSFIFLSSNQFRRS